MGDGAREEVDRAAKVARHAHAGPPLLAERVHVTQLPTVEVDVVPAVARRVSGWRRGRGRLWRRVYRCKRQVELVTALLQFGWALPRVGHAHHLSATRSLAQALRRRRRDAVEVDILSAAASIKGIARPLCGCVRGAGSVDGLRCRRGHGAQTHFAITAAGDRHADI